MEEGVDVFLWCGIRFGHIVRWETLLTVHHLIGTTLSGAWRCMDGICGTCRLVVWVVILQWVSNL